MSLLPDLDASGHLIVKKPPKVMPRTSLNQPHEKKFLSWENVLENRCPMCGEEFPQKEGDRECKNHEGNSFRIKGFRFTQIRRDIQAKNESNGDFIKHF